jgi:hypothetical protein
VRQYVRQLLVLQHYGRPAAVLLALTAAEWLACDQLAQCADPVHQLELLTYILDRWRG